MSDFTQLHNHSHYSLLDGLSKIPNLVKHVKELGMDAVAVTDHGVLYGVVEFYKAAKKAGILGWAPPADFKSVRECLKALKYGAFAN